MNKVKRPNAVYFSDQEMTQLKKYAKYYELSVHEFILWISLFWSRRF